MPDPTTLTNVTGTGAPTPPAGPLTPEPLAVDTEEYGARVVPQTYIEGRGALLMTIALIVIGLLCISSFGLWYRNLPTIEDARSLCQADKSIEATKMVEVLTSLKKAHTDGFKDMFQLIVLSGLIPIFTLLAGYVFGTRQQAQTTTE